MLHASSAIVVAEIPSALEQPENGLARGRRRGGLVEFAAGGLRDEGRGEGRERLLRRRGPPAAIAGVGAALVDESEEVRC